MKKALAVRKDRLALPRGFNGFFDAKSYKLFVEEFGTEDTKENLLDNEVELLERPACETNFDYLQFIGYIPVRVVTAEGVFVACYRRGKGGDEGRLHDLYSIGFGGHVDDAPAEGSSLTDHLIDHTVRELKEELGLDIAPAAMRRALLNGHYLYAPESEQDKVHLAMCAILDYPRIFELKTDEADQIDNLHWERLETLQDMATKGLLETWSAKMVQSNLLNA